MDTDASKGCKTIRCTEKTDMTKPSSVKRIIDIITDASKNNIEILLFSSIPCAGGSMWTNINALKPHGMEKLQQHWNFCANVCIILRQLHITCTSTVGGLPSNGHGSVVTGRSLESSDFLVSLGSQELISTDVISAWQQRIANRLRSHGA